MPSELKSCPFCKREILKVITHTEIIPSATRERTTLIWKQVFCYCGARGPFRDTEADAIAAWNTRSVDADKAEAVRLLKRLQWGYPASTCCISCGANRYEGTHTSYCEIKTLLARVEGK